MNDLSQKLINGDALDSFAKKLNDKIQEDIKEVDAKVSTHSHDDKYYTKSEVDDKIPRAMTNAEIDAAFSATGL
jgi:hypothetical protein